MASRSASRSAGDSASAGVAVGDKATSDTSDSCTWYAQGECFSPRTCFDCLNVLVRGDTCGIDLSTGACTSLGRLRLGSNSTLYSSQSSTYCAAEDAACADCNANWVDEYLNTNTPPANSAQCVGADGCVCLAVCAQPARESRISDDFCSLFGTQTTRVLAFGAVGIGVCLCFALLAMVTRYVLNRFAPEAITLPPSSVQRERRRRTRRIPRREPSGPQLDLSGWKAMREQLIQTENTTLSLPVVNAAVAVEDTGDDDDSDDSSSSSGSERETEQPTTRLEPNATAITVEQGDAYRPLSPSQLHAHRGPNS